MNHLFKSTTQVILFAIVFCTNQECNLSSRNLYHAIKKDSRQYSTELSIDQCNSTVSQPTFPSGHCIFYDMV